MRKVSREIEDVVVSKLEHGSSTRVVARELGLSQSCVQRIRTERLPNLRCPPAGRPRVLTSRQERACVQAVTVGGHDNAKEVVRDLREREGVNVSGWTVRRVLKRAGLSSRVKQRKPKLTQKHIKDRLDFAKRHQYWTLSDWERVVFSDESKINRFNSDGRSWCWVRNGQSSSCVQETVKHGGGSIMVWGCMTIHGCGLLIKINGKVNQLLYKQILEVGLYSTICKFELNPEHLIFQQDNASIHTTKMMKQWFKQQSFGLLQWPAQSPDLNPIEHLWALVKRRLNRYESAPSGILELWDRVQEIWCSISAEDCKRLYDSMPRRIAAVLASKGRWTKY